LSIKKRENTATDVQKLWAKVIIKRKNLKLLNDRSQIKGIKQKGMKKI
jgi:hypothetical protein